MNTQEKFRVRTGSIIGSEHQRRQVNNQDGYGIGNLVWENKDYLWGIVCDGCSAGLHSEVGANLLANYLSREIPYLISSGSSLREMPDQLFIAGLGYLRSLAAHTVMGGINERVEFVKHHLLCTVVGFILDDKKCIFFYAGDGIFTANDQITRIDQNNKPLYMAYHLLPKNLLNDLDNELMLKFSICEYELKNLDRLAVCSDGMEEEVMDEIWGQDHLLGLKRKLRVLRLHKKANFSDDCTVIAVEKNKEGGK